MKLYMNPMSANARRPRLVVRLCALEVEEIVVDLQRAEHLTPEFSRINPNRRVPALDDDGFYLWESNAICQYLAARAGRTDLWPADPREQADVSRWQLWNHSQWAPPLAVIFGERVVKGRLSGGSPDENLVAQKLAEFTAHARMLDDHLAQHRWLAAGRLTLAEVALACTLSWHEPMGLPLEAHPHLWEWFQRIGALAAWKETALPALPRASRGA